MALALLPVRLDATAPAAPWLSFDHDGDALASCALPIAGEILARIESDYLTTQVFLDFGRLFRPRLPRRAHTAIALADLERHTRLLGASLERIATAFEDISGDERPLFRMTADGSLLLHTATCEAVALLCRARRPRAA